MTARNTLDELAEFLDSELTVEVATVARAKNDADTPELRVLSLAENAEQFFLDIVDARVTDQLDPLAWSLKKLDPLYKPEREEIEWQQLAELAPVVYAVDKLTNLSALAPFDGTDEAYKKRLSYWATVLTDADGRQGYFFRSFSAQAELKRKRGAALVSRNGTFSVVQETIFLFDDQIDCFVFGEHVFVLRKHDFRRIFDQLAAVLRRAKRAAGDLHGKVPIANFDEFEKACSTDSRLADKVLAVRQRDYFDQLSYGMLEPVIQEFSLDIPALDVDGTTHLVFRSEPAHRFRILKLIDDDYLRSSMTNHRYEVNSKTSPPTP